MVVTVNVNIILTEDYLWNNGSGAFAGISGVGEGAWGLCIVFHQGESCVYRHLKEQNKAECVNKAQTCHIGPAFQARVHFGSQPSVAHSPSPLFEKLERNQLSASPQAVCHFLPSPSLNLSTEESFQINVFSSLKTFRKHFVLVKAAVHLEVVRLTMAQNGTRKGKKSNSFSSSGQTVCSKPQMGLP